MVDMNTFEELKVVQKDEASFLGEIFKQNETFILDFNTDELSVHSKNEEIAHLIVLWCYYFADHSEARVFFIEGIAWIHNEVDVDWHLNSVHCSVCLFRGQHSDSRSFSCE